MDIIIASVPGQRVPYLRLKEMGKKNAVIMTTDAIIRSLFLCKSLITQSLALLPGTDAVIITFWSFKKLHAL